MIGRIARLRTRGKSEALPAKDGGGGHHARQNAGTSSGHGWPPKYFFVSRGEDVAGPAGQVGSMIPFHAMPDKPWPVVQLPPCSAPLLRPLTSHDAARG